MLEKTLTTFSMKKFLTVPSILSPDTTSDHLPLLPITYHFRKETDTLHTATSFQVAVERMMSPLSGLFSNLKNSNSHSCSS